MIIETWFLLAISSALAGGVGAFLFKVASQEKVDIVTLSFCTSVITSIIVLGYIFIFQSFEYFWHPMLIFAFLTAATYLVTSVTKVKSLDSIDSAIFFPLYKVFGPMVVIIAGILIFEERFSVYETTGLLVSLFVPLLLITKREDSRQINLKRGLIFVIITAFIGGISAVFWKHGADIAPNAWTYILAGELFVLLSALISLLKKPKDNISKILLSIKRPLFIKMVLISSIASVVAASSFVFAFTHGGPLGIVYTINSLYILIPIILSIIFYNEHWNARKVLAIILSVVALAFFG